MAVLASEQASSEVAAGPRGASGARVPLIHVLVERAARPFASRLELCDRVEPMARSTQPGCDVFDREPQILYRARVGLPPVEPYIDGKELAALIGVSVDTIYRMVKAGMPSEMWGMRTRRFRASEAMEWARQRSR